MNINGIPRPTSISSGVLDDELSEDCVLATGIMKSVCYGNYFIGLQLAQYFPTNHKLAQEAGGKNETRTG